MRIIKIFFIIFLSFLKLYPILEDKDRTFEQFLDNFISKIEIKEEQVNKAIWLLETTGSKDAADLVATLDSEYKIYFSDEEVYEKLIYFEKDGLQNPILKRELKILLNTFKANMLPKSILIDLSKKEAELFQTYANFRANIEGKRVTENMIREILKNETDVKTRKIAWEASKEIGLELADKIIDIAKLRNKAANHLGYNNYFEMQLDLNEMSKEVLFDTFNDLKVHTDDSFKKMLLEVNEILAKTYNVGVDEIGTWAWKDPFCQIDPIESVQLKDLYADKDVLEIAKCFYEKMGFEIEDLVKRSDLYEKEGKNQHAFCIDIDRKGDVRTLNNIHPNSQWMETLLHEFGHGIYDLNIDRNLPWLLRTASHTITTEALALFMGRQAYTAQFLEEFLNSTNNELLDSIEKGIKRKQLVFSRSAFLITEFEKEFYSNPDQDLNKLWWDLFEKYYYMKRPENREDKQDWASKYHIGLAPVYYYCYLIGEVFASTLQKKILEVTKEDRIWRKGAAKFLTERLFMPGNKYRWDDLIEYVTGKQFSSDAWVQECN